MFEERLSQGSQLEVEGNSQRDLFELLVSDDGSQAETRGE